MPIAWFHGADCDCTKGTNSKYCPDRMGAQKCYERLFTFDVLPKLQTGQGYWRGSWGERKRWRKRVAEMLMIKRARPERPLDHAVVQCHRFSAQEPDLDNLTISFKGVVDAFVKEGVLVDDSPRHADLHFYWSHAPRGHGHIQIAITGD